LRESYKNLQYEYEHLRPENILDGLLNGETSYLKAYFTQFIICTENYFYDLIDDIKETIEEASFVREQRLSKESS
jgi:hypothetical protein